MGSLRTSGQPRRDLGPYGNAGAPTGGTDEVQTITIGGTPTGGTLRLRFEGQDTADIAWSSTNATLIANVQAALRALATVNGANLNVAAGSLTAGIGTLTVTFVGSLAKKAVPTIAVARNDLTGTNPTVAVAETTPGVNATARGVPKGSLLVDTTNAKLYINTGTDAVPVWTVVGTQT